MEDTDATIVRCILIANLTGTVLAAVVDEEQLKVPVCLTKYAVDAAVQGLLGIINRNYYRNQTI